MNLEIKNISRSVLDIGGIEVASDASIPVSGSEKLKLSSDEDFLTLLSNGDIQGIIGSGTLTEEETLAVLNNSMRVMKGGTVIAEARSIELSGNCTVTDLGNGKSGISIGTGLDSHIFSQSFSKSGGHGSTWMEWGEGGIYQYTTPFVLPFGCKLIGMTYSNRYNKTDVDLEIYKVEEANDDLKSDTQLLYWQIRDARFARHTNLGNSFNFIAGDALAIYLRDRGDNGDDAIVNLYFQITNGVQEEKVYDKYNNFNR